MMREIIYSLPNQISAAVGLAPDHSFGKRAYNNVLICGMGGSGISGDILAALYPQIQVISNKDYTIPGFVDKNTLSILVSYSGNTEETLNSYRQLSKRGIDMVLLSSNGKLFKKKAAHKIRVPSGLPPRGALGYLFTPLPILMHQANLMRSDPRKELLRLSEFLARQRDAIESKARRIARRFTDKLIIIYVDSSTFAPVANRWRCQFNENAKVLAHISAIPEMNHNEIVGLGRPKKFNADTLLVLISDPMAHPRNKIRRRLLKALIRSEISDIMEIQPEGKSNLQQIFYTIMLGDFISYYLALLLGVDPVPVERIEQLKKKLSRLK
jgi:glucose/mannose-6-phosphate isomerase